MATVIGTTTRSGLQEPFLFTPTSAGYIHLKLIKKCQCSSSSCNAYIKVGGFTKGTATTSVPFEVTMLEEHTISFSSKCCAIMEVLFSEEAPTLIDGTVDITSPLITDCDEEDALRVRSICLEEKLDILINQANESNNHVNILDFVYCNPETNTLWRKISRYITTITPDDVNTTEDILSNTDLGYQCSIEEIDTLETFCGDLTSLSYVESTTLYSAGVNGFGDSDITADESKVIAINADGITVDVMSLSVVGDITSLNTTPIININPAAGGITIDQYLFSVKTVGNNVYILDASNIYKYDYTTGNLLDEVNYVNALGVGQSSINDISVTADEQWLYYQSDNDSTLNTVDMASGLSNITTISSTVSLSTVITGYAPTGQSSFDMNDEGTIIYHTGYSSTAIAGNSLADGGVANTLITTAGDLSDLSLVSEFNASTINTNYPDMHTQEFTVNKDGKTIYISHEDGLGANYIISQYSMNCG